MGGVRKLAVSSRPCKCTFKMSTKKERRYKQKNNEKELDLISTKWGRLRVGNSSDQTDSQSAFRSSQSEGKGIPREFLWETELIRGASSDDRWDCRETDPSWEGELVGHILLAIIKLFTAHQPGSEWALVAGASLTILLGVEWSVEQWCTVAQKTVNFPHSSLSVCHNHTSITRGREDSFLIQSVNFSVILPSPLFSPLLSSPCMVSIDAIHNMARTIRTPSRATVLLYIWLLFVPLSDLGITMPSKHVVHYVT